MYNLSNKNINRCSYSVVLHGISINGLSIIETKTKLNQVNIKINSSLEQRSVIYYVTVDLVMKADFEQ